MSRQAPPSPESILEDFEKMAATSIDRSGFGLNQCLYWDNLKSEMVYMVLDLGLDSIPTPFWHCINIVDAAYTDYLILALDMNSAPGQGLEFADFVLVCEFDRRRPEPYLTSQWRYGVINYDKSQTPAIVRPVDWNNEFWKREGAAYMKRFGPPFRCIVKRKEPDQQSPQSKEPS